jgi:hypothetical protein
VEAPGWRFRLNLAPVVHAPQPARGNCGDGRPQGLAATNELACSSMLDCVIEFLDSASRYRLDACFAFFGTPSPCSLIKRLGVSMSALSLADAT